MKEVDQKNIVEMNAQIEELSQVLSKDYNIRINLHEARWICEGSGYITINNDLKIKFYIYKNVVQYCTEDRALLNKLEDLNLDIRIKEMWKLKKDIDSIINAYY